MFPILFEIPGLGFPVKSFGLMVVLGFLLSTKVLDWLVPRHADDPENERSAYGALPIWVLIGVLIGARLMYVVVEIARGSPVGQEFLDHPLRILAYWQGGLVMYGGTAGGFLAAVFCAKRHKLRLMNAWDLGVVAAFAGLFLGRIGCLLVGDDYGSIVPESFERAPFPLVIRVPDPLPEGSLFGEANIGQSLWATQIWMSLSALWLAWIGSRLLRRRRYAGQVTLALMVFYAILRSVIEIFRGDEVRGLWFNETLSTSQLISIVVGTVCFLLLIQNRKRNDPLLRDAQAETATSGGTG